MSKIFGRGKKNQVKKNIFKFILKIFCIGGVKFGRNGK
jgi:hypothetical protein